MTVVVYMLILLTAILGEVFPEQAGSGLRVLLGDAAATAHSMPAHKAEVLLVRWLLVTGVDVQRCNERAGA